MSKNLGIIIMCQTGIVAQKVKPSFGYPYPNWSAGSNFHSPDSYPASL